MNLMIRNRRRRGTSLIEVLVVIVVFLVGILAVVQIFPGGLNILRSTRDSTIADNLARAELERIKGSADSMAQAILPGKYVLIGSVVAFVPDSDTTERDMMPDGAVGVDGSNGHVFNASGDVGNWAFVSGANRVNRVIGEGKRVPAPRFIGSGVGGSYGGLMSLQFAPIYYSRQPSGVGTPGILELYGNNLVRRFGDRDANRPNAFGGYNENTFFYVDNSDTDPTDPFPNEDQLWIAPGAPRSFRISFTFNYNQGGNVQQFNLIRSVILNPGSPPPFAAIKGNYWVMSLQKLIAEPSAYGPSPYMESNYISTEYDSLSVQRVFIELPLTTAFSGDPYEYKVISANLGFILVNPVAFSYKVNKPTGREPLTARADYSVFDWRIIRDDFRVPGIVPYTIKTLLKNIKVKGADGPDGLRIPGLGVQTPISNGVTDDRDFVVLDRETGGVILPSSYKIDKSAGILTFIDEDGDPSNGMVAARISYPNADPLNPWQNNIIVPDIRGRSLRAMYMANGEWAPQVLKASTQYQVTVVSSPSNLEVGQCYVGGSNGFSGVPTRIYFPASEDGKKVIIGEIWYRDAANNLQVLQDQEFQVQRGQGDPFNRPFVDIALKDPSAVQFDYSNGYSVRRVRGASVSVRVLWNPIGFKLNGPTQADNLRALEGWMRSMKKSETETFLIGGQQ